MNVSSPAIARGLLLLWAAWFGVVTFSNAADGLVNAGVLPPGFRLASGNYQLIETVTDRLGRPDWMLPPLMIGVIAWEAVATALFARAFMQWPRQDATRRAAAVRTAYAVALGLWGAFLVVDELFIAYEMEATHLRLLIAHVVCLVASEDRTSQLRDLNIAT